MKLLFIFLTLYSFSFSETSVEDEQLILLLKDEIAPFTGFFMTRDIFENYEISATEAEDFKYQIELYEKLTNQQEEKILLLQNMTNIMQAQLDFYSPKTPFKEAFQQIEKPLFFILGVGVTIGATLLTSELYK